MACECCMSDYNDDDDNIPPPRQGLPVPLLAAGIAVGIFFFGLIVAVALTNRGNSADPKNTGTQDRVIEMGESVTVGDVRVSVSSANVGSVGAWSPGGIQIYSQESLLSVNLKIANANPNKTVNVSSAFGSTIKDDHGNESKTVNIRTDVGFKCRTEGAIDGAATVYSDRPIGDCLIFSRPVPGATYVLLTVDASHYGGRGKLIFKIPRSAWAPASNSQGPK